MSQTWLVRLETPLKVDLFLSFKSINLLLYLTLGKYNPEGM